MPLNEYQFAGDLNFTYVPMYGKFAGFGDFIFHYDAFIDGGVGVIRTRPIPVIDPDNRKFDWNNFVNFDVGIGFRIFFNRWLAAVLEVRDIMYFEKLEATTVAQGATDVGIRHANSPLEPGHLVRPEHALHERRPAAGRPLAVPADFLRIPVAQVRTETRTAMKRRFVRAVLAASAAAAAVLAVGADGAGPGVQLTGPLKGAPAVRHMRLYREGGFEIAPTVSFTLLDEYRRTILVGARLNYNIKDWIAIGVWGGVRRRQPDDRPDRPDRQDGAARPADGHQRRTTRATRTRTTRAATRPSPTRRRRSATSLAPQVTFIPFRGKLAIFNKIFVDTDFYAAAGVGIRRHPGARRTAAALRRPVVSCTDPKSFALQSQDEDRADVRRWASRSSRATSGPSASSTARCPSRGTAPASTRAARAPNGNFPDGQVERAGRDVPVQPDDHAVGSASTFPTKPKISE